MYKSVSVVTLTKDREHSLIRAVESVSKQDYRGKIEHIIIGDQATHLEGISNRLKAINPNVILHNFAGEYPDDVQRFFLVSKLGFLRNLGVQIASGEYVTQMGDDDFMDPNHISTLVDCIESESDVDVAYSWRRLVGPNGQPIVVDGYPWVAKARHLVSLKEFEDFVFESLMRAGVRERGSSIVKDCVFGKNGEPFFTVDTNCMLVRKSFHQVIPWRVQYNWREIAGDYSDDHMFVETCVKLGKRLKSTEQVTYNYTLGGVSQS